LKDRQSELVEEIRNASDRYSQLKPPPKIGYEIMHREDEEIVEKRVMKRSFSGSPAKYARS